jgi:hypothetical protein
MPYKDIEKRRETTRKYREANREKIKLANAAYRERNKETILERGRNHYHANKEYHKRYREENREKRLAYFKEWYANNREYSMAKNLEWAKNNRERSQKIKQKYAAIHSAEEKQRHLDYRNDLHRSYVARVLARHSSLAFADIPLGLIEAKTAHIKLLRALKGASK